MKSPIILFIAITGKPSEEKIATFMKDINEKAIDRVLLYPRSGCELEYLSDEWFNTINIFLKTAKALNMKVFLYDEFNWPSGDAGGRVTQNENFRLKSICVKGENKGEIHVHSSKHNASLFGEKFFPDLFNADAVDYFIKCTHEKYYEKFKEYFGTVIEAFFTDEPSIGYCAGSDVIPYYCGIESDYNALCGRDFKENLLSEHEFFLQDAYTVIGAKFRKSFFEKINNWCENHGILFTGHMLSDDEPYTATRNNGDILKNLKTLSLPGIDDIWTPLEKSEFPLRNSFSLYALAEYSATQNGAIAELFGLGPCDMSYACKRCMIYLMSCFKINYYLLGTSPLDFRGNRKITDYFIAHTSDQPDFSAMAFLSEEAKVAAEIAKKDFIPDVYLKYPTKVCMKDITNLSPNAISYVRLTTELSFNEIQFKYIDEGKDTNGVPVIEFDENMHYCFNGIVTADMKTVVDAFKKPYIVTHTDGTHPSGIFVRKFDDGSFVVLNMLDEAGIYLINGEETFLDKHGVFFSDIEYVDTLKSKKEPIECEFKLSYKNENMIRPIFLGDKKTTEIHAECDKDVRFAVRNDAECFINGEKINCTDDDNTLTDGFKEFYRISDTVKIKSGVTTLTGNNDVRYMPSVFIKGNFAVKLLADSDVFGIVLTDRKERYKSGEYFSDFGEVEYNAKVNVPCGVKAIELKGTSFLTKVFVNGKAVGMKAFSPYLFPVNEDLCGKDVKLKIVQYSSMAPIFADVNYFEKHCDNAQWNGTPKPSGKKFGFSEINWIY